MAQITCKNCGYPWATYKVCPNCGKSSNESGDILGFISMRATRIIALIFFIIVLLLLFAK